MKTREEEIKRINELVKDHCVAYRYAGYSFEEWLRRNDGTINAYVGWVGFYKENYLQEMREAYESLPNEIKVGLPCSVHYYSDTRAHTITEVILGKSGKNKGKVVKVGVRENNTICKDWYSSEYEILPELIGDTDYFTLRTTKRGSRLWVAEGSTIKDPAGTLAIGFHRHYIDPSF